MRKIFVFFLGFVFFLNLFLFVTANSGCWQFVHGTNYKVLMSSSPISPFENEEMSIVFSFVNGSEFLKDLDVNLKIEKEDFFDEERFEVEDGILEVKKRFEDSGVYDVVVEFSIEEVKEKYNVDFLIEVKEKRKDFYGVVMLLIGIVVGVLMGLKWKKK